MNIFVKNTQYFCIYYLILSYNDYIVKVQGRIFTKKVNSHIVTISTVKWTVFVYFNSILLVQLQGTGCDYMKLNQAISKRLTDLLSERNMTQYRLYILSGVPKSTINNIVICAYDSVKLRIIHELCQGLNISITEFFNSPIFDEENLEP